MKMEITILKNLLQNEDYARKVLPFLNDKYFTENSDKIIYNQINNFILEYNSLPNKEALNIELDELVDTGQIADDTPSFDIATSGKFKKQDFVGFDYE